MAPFRLRLVYDNMNIFRCQYSLCWENHLLRASSGILRPCIEAAEAGDFGSHGSIPYNTWLCLSDHIALSSGLLIQAAACLHIWIRCPFSGSHALPDPVKRIFCLCDSRMESTELLTRIILTVRTVLNFILHTA